MDTRNVFLWHFILTIFKATTERLRRAVILSKLVIVQNKNNTSSIDQFVNGSTFHRVLSDRISKDLKNMIDRIKKNLDFILLVLDNITQMTVQTN